MKYEALRDCRKDNTNWKNFSESIKPHHPHFAEEIKSKLDLYTNFTIFYLHQKSPFQKLASSRPLFQNQPAEPPPPLPAYLPVLWDKKLIKLTQNYWKVPSAKRSKGVGALSLTIALTSFIIFYSLPSSLIPQNLLSPLTLKHSL